MRTEPSPEVVAALGPRPTDWQQAAAWDRTAALTSAYEERWRDRETDPSHRREEERRAVEAAKRAWQQARDGARRTVDRGLGR